MKDNKKIIISSILGVIALCIITLSLTYAYWQINKNQTGENVVNTDCFNIEFVGENDINLPKAYPMKDEELEEFIGSATPYTFTITNRCSSLASATINMETVPVVENKLDDEWIDVLLYDAKINNPESYLNKSKKLTGNLDNTENKVIETSEKAYALHSFTLKANEEKKFNLLIYMNKQTPAEEENMNATWKGKITLSADYKVDQFANEVTLRQISEWSDEKGMWGYKDNITKLVIENKLTSKTGTIVHGPFDESSDSSNSIQSYVVCEEEDTNCIGYLQEEGGIKLNPNSSFLFYNFFNVTEIEGLENLDTSNVLDMSYMFDSMSSLQNLDLSQNSFNTSKVKNMSQMFCNMNALQTINLGSNFDTSNVTDMSSMFFEMNVIEELNLGDKFDTRRVINMSEMFDGMSALPKLNLGSNFDTSSVTDMSSMFSGMESLQSLDLSNYNFDTHSVKNMNEMFGGMHVLKELDLGDSFDTSNVEDMSSMFTQMESLQSLDLSKYNFNTSRVTDMQFMFSEMSALQELNLGNNFNTSNVEDMYGMFEDNKLLTTINYGSNFIHKESANIESMFFNCPAPRPDINTHSSWTGVDFEGV